MTSGEPRHSVDSRLTIVDTWLLSLESADEGAGPVEVRPGLQAEDGPVATPPAAAMRESSSSVRPCVASGAGSTPRRVKRSASEAKQRSAPSDTCGNTRRISLKPLEPSGLHCLSRSSVKQGQTFLLPLRQQQVGIKMSGKGGHFKVLIILQHLRDSFIMW